MIKFREVGFRYENNLQHSVQDISFEVEQGECIVLAGESGCGKSTITHCLSGLIPHHFQGEYSGAVLIEDHTVSQMPIHKISEKVGVVFQDPRSQFFTLDTRSELAFTCENFGVEPDVIACKIRETTSLLEIESVLDRKLFTLSSGEKQKVAIASVLTMAPKILVLDEPSANLDFPSVEVLKGILMKLKTAGYTLIVSEHRLYYLMDIMDRVVILKKGSIDKIWTKKQFERTALNDLDMLGLRSLNFPPPVRRLFTNSNEKAEVVGVRSLDFYYNKGKGVLKNVSFSLYRGDAVALIGKNGTGKTTLAKLLSGLRKETSGQICLNGSEKPYEKRRKEVAFVMQDADYQLFAESVYQELLLGSERLENIESRIESALQIMNLSECKEAHPAALSGGEKQRITISMAMIKEASLIIMDEPTSGLDRKNMEQVCKMVRYFSNQGKAVLLITHDYEFIINSCNRALYLKSGAIQEDIDLTNASDKLLECFDEMKMT